MAQLQTQQDLGRAKNVLQDYLIRKLLIPKVYLDADWSGAAVDVLAIDRSGVGDVHAVKIISRNPDRSMADSSLVVVAREVFDSIEAFQSFPSHYRYVAIVSSESGLRPFVPSEPILQASFASDGVGRVGVMGVDLSQENPAVQLILKPERFRSSKEIVELTDKFVAEHTPNWQIPDEDRL